MQSKIASIDATAALAVNGVHGFISAVDIPKVHAGNVLTGSGYGTIFVAGKVLFAGQFVQ